MTSVGGYRWGASLFAITTVACVAVMPHAVQCCSHFSEDVLKLRAEFGPIRWSPSVTPLAVALLDWPMGFRLLLLTLVAAVICLAATLASIWLVSDDRSITERPVWKTVGQAILASLMVGVLYILAIYATGFVGYPGPLNILWVAGVPAAIAVMIRPRPLGMLMTIPLAIGGWIAVMALSIGLGIAID